MRQGWEIKPLGDVCKFVNGFAFKSERFCSSGMPVGRIGDLNGVGLSLDKVVYANQKDYKEKLDKYVVQPGQLLIAMSGATTGKLGFNNTGQLIYQNQRVGRFLPSATLDVKYLYYYLTTKIANMLAISAGAAQPNLSTKQINEVEIPLPPLDEQKRIVAVLDEAFAGLETARANAEANLKSAEELYSATINSLVQGFEGSAQLVSIGELVKRGVIEKPIDGNHGETHPKKADFVSQGVPFIMASDLQDGNVNQGECYFITEQQASTLRKGFAQNGDVLISHKGTIGRVARLVTGHNYVVLTPQVTYYRVLDEKVLSKDFLYFSFLSSAFQRSMKTIAGSGSTRAYIGITKQLDLTLPLPSIEKQLNVLNRLEHSVEEISTLSSAYSEKVSSCLAMRQSLLQKAFAGELT